ncbi:CD225/dispanin family protein [bacterium]|nr:CD225/dispanin family protein [bacterium]MBU1637254.1 CD225/dispanin family protein [bacterium]MBU1920271.1 CD225/dispanin family protein [bacterium]
MTIPPVSNSEPVSGSPQPPQRFEEPVPTYLAPAVLVTILCCLPAGIVAVYFASRVSSLQAIGNRVAAYQASDKARLWCWISGFLGLIWPLLIISLIVAGGVGFFEFLDECGIP